MSVPAVFLSQLFTRKSAVFSGDSIVIYDYLVTFPLELKYIWNAPWTVNKTGFLMNRYGNLFGQTFIMMEETGYLAYGSTKFCIFYGSFCMFYVLFTGESIRILVLMRAWAIWGCTFRMTVFLITLYTVYLLAMVAVGIYPLTKNGPSQYLYLEQIDACISPVLPQIVRYEWIAWTVTLLLDTMVLAMVGRSLQKFFRGPQGIRPSPLIYLLVRDAILFYAITTFHNAFSLICWSMFSTDPRSFLPVALSSPLLSVIGQRLILNLREFHDQSFMTRDISREVNEQVAIISGFVWPSLEASGGQENEEQSESNKTSPMTRTIDIELELIEVRRDQGLPGDRSFPVAGRDSRVLEV